MYQIYGLFFSNMKSKIDDYYTCLFRLLHYDIHLPMIVLWIHISFCCIPYFGKSSQIIIQCKIDRNCITAFMFVISSKTIIQHFFLFNMNIRRSTPIFDILLSGDITIQLCKVSLRFKINVKIGFQWKVDTQDKILALICLLLKVKWIYVNKYW